MKQPVSRRPDSRAAQRHHVRLRSCAAMFSVVAALTGGCGTTVTGAQLAGGSGSELGAPGAQAGSSADDFSAQVGGTQTPTRPGSSAATVTGGSQTSDTSEVTRARLRSAGKNTPGGRHLPALKIGFLLQDFRFGAQGPDPMQGFKDLVAYLNAHGGLAGRRIDADFYAENANEGTLDSNAQKACTRFAEDEHVQLVVSDEMYHPNLQQCLGAARIPQVDAGIAFNPDAVAQHEAPYYMGPTTIGRDRYEPALLSLALKNSWVRSGQKIGVLIQDCPLESRIYDKVIVPTARAAGPQLVPERFDCSEGLKNLGSVTAQIQSSVLKFRSEGVTAVMADSSAESVVWAFFGPQAQQQQYHPTYLMTSDAYPYQLATSHSGSLSFPVEQLPQMRGIGWMPVADVGPKAPVAASQGTQQTRCLQMSQTHGNATLQSDGGGTSNVLSEYLQECDALLLAGELLAATGGSTALPDLAGAYPSVLSAFVSASSPTGRYSPRSARGDGVDVVTPFTYDARCQCTRYVGPPQHVD